MPISDQVEDTELVALYQVARGLRARLESLDSTALAWALLWDADELHPWTERAQACWERVPDQPAHLDSTARTADSWRLHHLAVLHHARAYDAENATPPRPAEALPQWEKALEYWARLHRCTTFWEALQRYLDDTTGRLVPAEVLDAVRERLPDDLLAVHTALAIEYRVDDPAIAAAHMRLVTQSGFPAESVAAARHGLVADLDNTTAQEIERVQFGSIFDYIVDWLSIDPTNPWLLRNLLYVSNCWAQFLNSRSGWTDQLALLFDRTEQILQIARTGPGSLPDVFAGELARYESWRGFWRLQCMPTEHASASPEELRSRLRLAELAVSHMRRALELDPSVRLEAYYQVEKDLAGALIARAELKLLLGWDLRGVESDLSEAREYETDLSKAIELQARLRTLQSERGID